MLKPVCFVGLKSFWSTDHRMATGCRGRRPGEPRYMTRVPPVLMACFVPPRSSAVTQVRVQTPFLSLTQWTTSTRPGLHRASGDGV